MSPMARAACVPTRNKGTRRSCLPRSWYFPSLPCRPSPATTSPPPPSTPLVRKAPLFPGSEAGATRSRPGGFPDHADRESIAPFRAAERGKTCACFGHGELSQPAAQQPSGRPKAVMDNLNVEGVGGRPIGAREQGNQATGYPVPPAPLPVTHRAPDAPGPAPSPPAAGVSAPPTMGQRRHAGTGPRPATAAGRGARPGASAWAEGRPPCAR